MSGIGAEAAERLAALGSISIEPGLTDDEFARVEETYGFEFADDHRDFLGAGLPVGRSWPDWRNGARRGLAGRLQFPADGVVFDVEHNQFWYDGWGSRPAQMKHALRTAKYELARVPQMVPVYSHRYLPAGRGSSGHPVLSMYQTEIIVYGADLADYIDSEFGPDRHPAGDVVSTVAFWSDLVG